MSVTNKTVFIGFLIAGFAALAIGLFAYLYLGQNRYQQKDSFDTVKRGEVVTNSQPSLSTVLRDLYQKYPLSDVNNSGFTLPPSGTHGINIHGNISFVSTESNSRDLDQVTVNVQGTNFEFIVNNDTVYYQSDGSRNFDSLEEIRSLDLKVGDHIVALLLELEYNDEMVAQSIQKIVR